MYDLLYTTLDKALIIVVLKLFECKEQSCKITVACPIKLMEANVGCSQMHLLLLLLSLARSGKDMTKEE